jgi:hypothetical protein
MRGAITIFVVALAWGYVMDDDHHAEQAMDAERREWAQSVKFCHRVFGLQTQPEYDSHDQLVCVGRLGQKHPVLASK